MPSFEALPPPPRSIAISRLLRVAPRASFQSCLGTLPLAEQQRIVAKVDELMAICDRLEEQLTTVRAESSRLLESVLHHALSDTLPHTAMVSPSLSKDDMSLLESR
jgi:hypothetical protein